MAKMKPVKKAGPIEGPSSPRLEESSSPERTHSQFPIVGIGASAGGLEAFTELLQNIPEKTGMAYVFVQHLDPTHGSVLPELLARAAKIPVKEAKDGVNLAPDHAYVIPANTTIALSDGQLRVGARELTRGVHLPIDQFFNSLAEERGDRAIGVVLSGTASDGTEGCRAIKSAGGITFAQDEKSAKYSSMPHSAARAGCIDFVLPPKAIAHELRRLSQHPYMTRHVAERLAETLPPDGGDMKTLLAMVAEATGVDFAHYKQTTLQRRIKRRMVLHRVETLEDYLRYVRANPAELVELQKDVLIHVTRFFRDKEAFDALNTIVFPSLIKDRKGDDGPIRIWVPGCSTGEKVYSIAMLLQEYLWAEARHLPNGTAAKTVQIFATDISDLALDRARSGTYTDAALAGISAERIRRFFGTRDGHHQINKTTREMCIFAKQNVTKDPPFSNLDLVSCRNLLIYLSPILQERVIPMFHYALKPSGFLMLGNSESLGKFSEDFTLVDKKNKIYQKKRSNTRLMTYFGAPGRTPHKTENTVLKLEPSDVGVEKEVERVLMRRFVPASIVVNDDLEIVQIRGRTGRYLEPAPGHPTFSLARMAREGLLVDLRSALSKAKKENAPVRREGVRVQSNGDMHEVNLEVIPIRGADVHGRFYLVVFEESRPEAEARIPAKALKGSKRQAALQHERERSSREIKHLKEQLQTLIEEHETTVEEYKSANEEALSGNEELQSTNEELETAKEELQSANEELTTLNEELQNRNTELTLATNDLVNVLDNVPLPILIVNHDLAIRRFTPHARELFNLLPTDVGRRLGDLRPNLQLPNLEELVRESVEKASTTTQEVRGTKGNWLQMRLRPYRTADNRIDGAVISFENIDAMKRELEHSLEYGRALIENAREATLLLDGQLRAAKANRTFYEEFGVSSADTEGRFIYELGNGQWNIPLLRELLQKVISGNKRIDDYEVRHNFPGIGMRTMILNARRIEPEAGGFQILLSIEDITDQKQRDQSGQTLATLVNLAGDAVIIRTLEGEITFWNRGAEEIYGWTRREALGKNLAALLRTEFPSPHDEIMAQLKKDGHWEGTLIKKDKGGATKIIESRWMLREEGGKPMILQISTDATAKQETEKRLQALSGRLMRVQDDERRRIARELHDSTGQKLAAAKMTLEGAQRRGLVEDPEKSVAETVGLIEEALGEIRTLSQLLHPPLLDETGLVSAVKYTVEGFSERSGIAAEFFAPKNFERLSQDAELALFRILQESLSNILRHSGAKSAKVQLSQAAETVTLEISDDGKGMPPGAMEKPLSVFGVGMIGMRQRLEQLGGRLEIHSSPGKGTRIRAVAPRTKRAAAAE